MGRQGQVPALESIAEEWRDRQEGDVHIQDMAREVVGRVPMYLCNAVHVAMRVTPSARHAPCFFTGETGQGEPFVGGGSQLRAHVLY